MNREQMEAWCALEGLGLHQFVSALYYPDTHRFRIFAIPRMPHTRMLTSDGDAWEFSDTGSGMSIYEPIEWEEMPDELFDDLTIELLTELTKK